MSVRDSSLDALRELEFSGNLSRQERAIMLFFLAQPLRDFTRAEVSRATGIRLSAVCGRINELIEGKRLLVDNVRRRCEVSGRSCHAVSVNVSQRDRERFERAARQPALL